MISHDKELNLRTTNIILKQAQRELESIYGEDKKMSHSVFVNNFFLGDQLVLMSREATLLNVLANSLKSILEANGENIEKWI